MKATLLILLLLLPLTLIAAEQAVEGAVDNPLREISTERAHSLLIGETDYKTGRVSIKLRIEDPEFVRQLFPLISLPRLSKHRHFGLAPAKGPYIFLDRDGAVLAAFNFPMATSPGLGVTLLEVRSEKDGFRNVGRLHCEGDQPGFCVPAESFHEALKKFFARFDPTKITD